MRHYPITALEHINFKEVWVIVRSPLKASSTKLALKIRPGVFRIVHILSHHSRVEMAGRYVLIPTGSILKFPHSSQTSPAIWEHIGEGVFLDVQPFFFFATSNQESFHPLNIPVINRYTGRTIAGIFCDM
jgi:hypothetical protein